MQGHRPGNYSWKLVMIHITPSRCPSSLVRFSPSPKLGFFFFFFLFSCILPKFPSFSHNRKSFILYFLGVSGFQLSGMGLGFVGCISFLVAEKTWEIEGIGFWNVGFRCWGAAEELN